MPKGDIRFAMSYGMTMAPPPVQVELWVLETNPKSAEISVIFYPDRGNFEIAYFEGRNCRIQEGFIFSIEEVAKKLEEVRRKVDPDAFDKGRARFVRRRPRTREDVAREENNTFNPCPSCGGGDLMSKCEVCRGIGFVRS